MTMILKIWAKIVCLRVFIDENGKICNQNLNNDKKVVTIAFEN